METSGLRIGYVTCCENGFWGLPTFIRSCHQISVVFTIPPELGRKYNISGYVDVTPWCRQHGLAVEILANYELDASSVAPYNLDVLLVNGWNRLIKEDVLRLPPLGGLAVHAGHPPIGLGRAPIAWNILLGHEDLEVYVFRMTPEADNGAIMASRVVEITHNDKARLVYEKVAFAASDLFIQSLGELASGVPGRAQELSFARYYPKRGPEDGLIDFCWSDRQIYNFVRAVGRPYPGAFTYLNQERWTIWDAVPFDRYAYRDTSRWPGRILAALPAGLVVQTGGAPIWIVEAECDGRTIIPCPWPTAEHLVGSRFTTGPYL